MEVFYRQLVLQVLLVKRREEKFAGLWSLPGGFVAEDEPLEAAALRELHEATGVRDVYLEQLYTFGDPGRDTRGRVVSVAYVALLAADRCPLVPNDLEAEARWYPVYELPDLAFDQLLQVHRLTTQRRRPHRRSRT